MTAAAAAWRWWAARRPRPSQWEAPAESVSPVRPLSARVARGTSVSLTLLAAAMIACAVIGLAVARHNDLRQQNERHAALQQALSEFHAVFGDAGFFDEAQVRLIERRSALSGLRFETDPASDGNREVQSVLDAKAASSAGSVGRLTARSFAP